MKPAVPRRGVDDVLARSAAGPDCHVGRHASGTQDARAASRRRVLIAALELAFPNDLAAGCVDGVDVVGNTGLDDKLPGAVFRLDAADDERLQEVVHLPRLIIELDFPEELQ